MNCSGLLRMSRWLGCAFWVLCGLLPTGVYAQDELGQAAAAALPPGFALQTVTGGLHLPTDMALLPSGDILALEKGRGDREAGVGQVRLVRQGVLRPEPVMALSANVYLDSGLLALALDPDFADNHAFYIWYGTGKDSPGWTGESVNRLSRFIFDPLTGTADPRGETIILDGVTWSDMHNGGGLSFDDAGNLLITTGDAAASLHPQENLAPKLTSLNGKALRIRPRAEGGYTVPAGNPFVNRSDARPEIYAFGLRNPFRAVWRAADQRWYALDVGLDAWEEINVIRPGANYGWPLREGPCPIGVRDPDCEPAGSQYTDPMLAYPLAPGVGGAVTALAFYEGNGFPAEYRGKLFYADLNSRWIAVTSVPPENPRGGELFATEVGMLVDMEATASGLYLLDIASGRISLLYYSSADNRPPVAQLAAAPLVGSAPLEVHFSAAGSQDADDLGLTYHWDFGDGSQPVTTALPTVSHLYQADGNYQATLAVRDLRGAESETLALAITVYSGEFPAIAQENLVEPGRSLYQGGDRIRFRAQRQAGSADLDATLPYFWDVELHHNQHVHPVLSQVAGDEVLLEIPVESHGEDANLWYRIYLTMQTASGQQVRIHQDLHPQVVAVQAATWPGAAPVYVNQVQRASGEPFQAVVGQRYLLEAPATLLYAEGVGEFAYWVVAEGWPLQAAEAPVILSERQATVTIGPAPKSYVAFYRYLGPAHRTWLPRIETGQP
ncbi:MAG TPA: PQQ-dependent sugar dehydrogenase [Caldilineaceae bacterium]|nr:PQQ-dependent sugar dehydrogenase [Caldilineaceae bacterium]